jgi:energy-coupling factor transporter transmembrane protein EcfT
MNTIQIFYLLYPYPYQIKAQLFAFLFLAIVVIIAHYVFSLIIGFMSSESKKWFNNMLKFTGIILILLFFAEMTVSLVTIHHVNTQLGFTYATPETPEGELFEIQKVVPGKIMDQAGLKRFDQIQMTSVNDLYRLLIENQGNVVSIPVIRDKQEVIVKVNVPNMKLPLADVSFLIL